MTRSPRPVVGRIRTTSGRPTDRSGVTRCCWTQSRRPDRILTIECADGSQRRASPHVPAQPPRSEALWRGGVVGRSEVARSAVLANLWHARAFTTWAVDIAGLHTVGTPSLHPYRQGRSY